MCVRCACKVCVKKCKVPGEGKVSIRKNFPGTGTNCDVPPGSYPIKRHPEGMRSLGMRLVWVRWPLNSGNWKRRRHRYEWVPRSLYFSLSIPKPLYSQDSHFSIRPEKYLNSSLNLWNLFLAHSSKRELQKAHIITYQIQVQ